MNLLTSKREGGEIGERASSSSTPLVRALFNLCSMWVSEGTAEKKKKRAKTENNKTGPAAAARKGGEGQYNKNPLRQQKTKGKAMGALGGVGSL